MWLALRSLAWAILLPGMVAGYVPWRFLGLRHIDLDVSSPSQLVGLACIAAGAAVLGTCIWAFAASGRGTLSPADPPRQLVVRGLYRYVRNPMYVGVTIVVAGEAILAHSRALLAYLAAWLLCVNAFVLGYEEPALHRKFGASYREYKSSVNRWLPTFRGRSAVP